MNEHIFLKMLELQGEIKVAIMKTGLFSQEGVNNLSGDIAEIIFSSKIIKPEAQAIYTETRAKYGK